MNRKRLVTFDACGFIQISMDLLGEVCPRYPFQIKILNPNNFISDYRLCDHLLSRFGAVSVHETIDLFLLAQTNVVVKCVCHFWNR
jgi:hypothetical protein